MSQRLPWFQSDSATIPDTINARASAIPTFPFFTLLPTLYDLPLIPPSTLPNLPFCQAVVKDN